MTPDTFTTVYTTIGELAQALYDEALHEFGDEKTAEDVANAALRDLLARRTAA